MNPGNGWRGKSRPVRPTFVPGGFWTSRECRSSLFLFFPSWRIFLELPPESRSVPSPVPMLYLSVPLSLSLGWPVRYYRQIRLLGVTHSSIGCLGKRSPQVGRRRLARKGAIYGSYFSVSWAECIMYLHVTVSVLLLSFWSVNLSPFSSIVSPSLSLP